MIWLGLSRSAFCRTLLSGLDGRGWIPFCSMFRYHLCAAWSEVVMLLLRMPHIHDDISAIDHGYQARTTEFYTTPVAKAWCSNVVLRDSAQVRSPVGGFFAIANGASQRIWVDSQQWRMNSTFWRCITLKLVEWSFTSICRKKCKQG